jgi:hypothetical protein
VDSCRPQSCLLVRGWSDQVYPVNLGFQTCTSIPVWQMGRMRPGDLRAALNVSGAIPVADSLGPSTSVSGRVGSDDLASIACRQTRPDSDPDVVSQIR